LPSDFSEPDLLDDRVRALLEPAVAPSMALISPEHCPAAGQRRRAEPRRSRPPRIDPSLWAETILPTSSAVSAIAIVVVFILTARQPKRQ
jgi:hypothetical protein